MPPKPRPRKGSMATRDAPVPPKSTLMPPPPDPPKPPLILEPEITALSACLKNATVKTGQIFEFYADTRRLGIEKHAPKPPRSLTESLGRELEKYDQIVDSVESHLLQAIAALQRDLRREEQRLKLAEEASVATRTRSKSASASPTSTRVPLPTDTIMGDDSQFLRNAPVSTPTNSPPAPPSSGPGRRPSAISISSLHRPAFPLKLDLSSSALRLTAEEASMFSSGLASPVTIAPKSARAIGPNEFPPDFMAALVSSSSSLDRPVDIDLTLPETDAISTSGMKDAPAGSTVDKPIELDLDSMDIDMSMTDLFGDTAETGTNDADAAMDGLFSPVVVQPDGHSGSVDGKPIKTETPFHDTMDPSNNTHDIFASLDVNADPNQALKDTSEMQSVPSPTSLLASLSSASQLSAIDPLPGNNVHHPDPSFDLGSLDLSNLSPSFFENTGDSDMNFSIDMDQFLAMGPVGERKEDGEAKNAAEPT